MIDSVDARTPPFDLRFHAPSAIIDRQRSAEERPDSGRLLPGDRDGINLITKGIERVPRAAEVAEFPKNGDARAHARARERGRVPSGRLIVGASG